MSDETKLQMCANYGIYKLFVCMYVWKYNHSHTHTPAAKTKYVNCGPFMCGREYCEQMCFSHTHLHTYTCSQLFIYFEIYYHIIFINTWQRLIDYFHHLVINDVVTHSRT